MAWKTANLKIVGVTPLLMHSGRLIDPLSPAARAVAAIAKRTRKTEADHLDLAKAEFIGSLNLFQGEPCIPGEQAEAMLRDGARRTKQGKKALAGVLCPANYPLIYDGPRSYDGLWADERYRLRVPVKVGQARLMRTRPLFPEWACEIAVEFNDGILDEREIVKWAAVAGSEVGLGDWRPKFGRFTAEAVH